ncbi:MAG TPA: tetratricopeptide repeat protein [Myxococcales bacterium]|nr:tetratricopeptide repeat protein [Myxococcales bacterium]
MATPAGGPKPSASEISALEQAFAQDPMSDAYRPLAEAYLSLGRFMEAMVVAKKGVKARPADATPRVLLARIYAEQGKDKKAIEELHGATAAQPNDLAALRMLAGLQLKTGEAGGPETLLKAHAAGPADAAVLDLMTRYGVKPPAPPPPPIQLAQAMPLGQSGIQAPPLQLGRSGISAPAPVRSLSRVGFPQADGSIAPARSPSGPPLQGPVRSPSIIRQMPVAVDTSHWQDESMEARIQRGVSSSAKISFAIFFIGVAALLGWFGYTQYKNARDRKVTKLLKQTKDQLAKDDYAGYQEAEKDAQQVLDLDPTNFAADAYVAYIDALRYGENGEGSDYLTRSQTYLAKAKAQGQPHAYIYAADAYLKYFTGDPKGAEQGLSDVLHDAAGGQRSYNSDLLSGTLGIVQMGEGKLTEARKNLVDAHNLAPADVRVTSMLGALDARVDSAASAAAFFQQALQIDPDHVPSNLGLALLDLQETPPDVAGAQKLVDHLDKLGPGAMSPRQSSFEKFVHAQLLYAEGKAGPAAEEEKLAMDLDQKNVDMPIIAGRRLLRAGQFDKAIASFRKAIDLDPNRPVALADLGRAYLAEPGAAGAAKAVQQLRDALTRSPQDARLMVLLGEALQRTGDAEHAREQWQAATARDPDNADALYDLAHYWAAKTDAAKAKTAWQAVAQHTDGQRLAEADTELGRLALARGDAPAAQDLFARALSASASYAPPYFFAGQLLLRDRAKRRDGKKLMGEYLRLAPGGAFAAEARHLAR